MTRCAGDVLVTAEKEFEGMGVVRLGCGDI